MLKVIRVVVVLAYFFTVALLGSLVSLLRPFNPDNTRLCGRLFSWGAIRLLGVDLKIEGLENLRDMQPGIVLANHQSNLDLFVHGAVIPRRTVSVGKKSLAYLPLFGQVYWLAGNILIDRANSRQSIDTMTQVSEAIKHRATSIWVFPEGTRNRGKGLQAFKKGAFHMAINAQAPIYPICASTYAGRLELNRWRSGTIRVRILPPIPTRELGHEDIQPLMAQVSSTMRAVIEEMDQQLDETALRLAS